MSYIIMAIQEEGSETRVGPEFQSRAAATEYMLRHEDDYPEYATSMINRDAAYWYEHQEELDDPRYDD